MAWSPMVSLELTDEEKLDIACPVGCADAPDYPWSMRISFDDDILERFGCDVSDFTVGDVILLKCVAKVTGLSSNDTATGPKSRVEFQITDLSIMGEGDDDDE